MVDSAGLWSIQPLLVSKFVSFRKHSPDGESCISANLETTKSLKPSIELESTQRNSGDYINEYSSLQLRIFRITLFLTVFSFLFTTIVFDFSAAISLLIGAFSGILYFRLLAKSIGSLGKNSSSVSKFQLIVPVLLVLVVSKLPDLHLIPALMGFLLYKPSLILQFLLEPKA